ncbi:hypothetical protein M378DRAFT_1041026 [Amanita muscaria Koide BX008]|uniref:Piwi domain-containing protein n=1 Tax=Amanita muscaria (strain Koide BX008) TaxID=946122 RepID=A0A0C2X622_AMAMK|nr:hypothetical protein M378DRAFT_1041026 [Amanita muscaria Koide BX008]
MPASRRNFKGTLGERTLAITNSFQLSWSGQKVYHYHVVFSRTDPLPASKASANPNDDDTIPRVRRQELIMQLQNEIRPDIFSTTPGAFDGRNNLYSVRPYNFTSPHFEVPFNPPQGNRPPRLAKITIELVNDIDRRHIKGLLESNENDAGNEAALTLNMLNVFVQAQPRMQQGALYNARSFYIRGHNASNQKALPFELWQGYYQTVRPTFDKLIINIDFTVGVIIPERPLLDVFVNYSGRRDARDVLNANRDSPMFKSLRLFAKRLKFTINLPGHNTNRKQRPREIKDLVPDCGAYTFDKRGQEATVAQHFQQVHGMTIAPRTLGIKTKKGDVFPVTACRTTAQLYKGKNAPNVVSEAMRFMPQTPQERLAKIQSAWQHLKYAESSFMTQAGLTVDEQPLAIQERTLPRPNLIFNGNREERHKSPGVWDVMHKKFLEPAKFTNWTVVSFVPNASIEALGKFVDGLLREARERDLKPPHNISKHNPHSDVPRILAEEGKSAAAHLMLIILPDPAEDLRNAVKRFGDIEQGVPTQCVKWNHKREQDVMSGRGGINQYHNNLLLKINVRMGGTNFAPKKMWFQDKVTMVLGADVSHPGPGSGLPSISALVASVDRLYTRYIAETRVQDPREEMIEDLENMFEKILRSFYDRTKGHLPQQLIFYRDGVSEGEFNQVIQFEVPRLKAAVKKAPYPENKAPELIVVIVGKKHHVRFFPGDQSAQDKRGNDNLYPGFIVDRNIVHPIYPDFYLQSQAGLKGTSRPTHYTVLSQGSLSADQLQEFTFNLCHCYLRATRSVKIPAPVYYADLVCSRAKFHYSDNASMSGESSKSESFDLQWWQKNFSPIKERMAGSMYWI